MLHPGTGQPVGPDDLAPLFPMELILQEVSEEAEIAIPDEVLDIYRLWRPTPLYRAHRLEQAAGTRSRIFYKYEGVSPAGSHKPNTAVAQAFYNKQEGRTRLSTETGAGQWGSALAFACKLIGLECKVYMVRDLVRPEAVPALDDPGLGRRDRREPVGGHAVPAARSSREHPDSPGSLGIAISEAVEDAAGRDDTAVLARQRAQPRAAAPDGDRPGGARADGARRRVPGRRRSAASAAARTSPGSRSRSCARRSPAARSTCSPCEPAACPTLTRGLFAYDFGDTSKLTPLVAMHTLGHDFVPAPIHAGGLRYHGVAPLISQLVRDGLIRAEAYLPERRLRLGGRSSRAARGSSRRPSPSHAIHGALQAAKAADEAGEERTILFNLSGHGHFDMAAYDNYLAGKLEDVALDEDEIERALHAIEGLPSPA